MSVKVALDVYPANVTLPSGAVISRARALVADGRILIYVMNNGVPTLYFERDLQATQGVSPMSGVHLTAEDGTVSVRKAGGCGCGSRLKSFNPFPGQVRAKVAL